MLDVRRARIAQPFAAQLIVLGVLVAPAQAFARLLGHIRRMYGPRMTVTLRRVRWRFSNKPRRGRSWRVRGGDAGNRPVRTVDRCTPVARRLPPRNAALGLVRHEQPRAHLLVGVGVEVPQLLEPRAQVVRQAVGAVLVDLDEVAGRVAHVELDDVARELDEAVPERDVVERAAPLGRAVDRLEVVDGDPEVVVAGRREVALEQVQLGAAEREPLDRDAEVRRGDRLRAEQVDVEVHRLLQVEGVDADVVDPQAHRRPFASEKYDPRPWQERSYVRSRRRRVVQGPARQGGGRRSRRSRRSSTDPRGGGCILYALHQGTDDPSRLAFVERWASRELLDAHLRSPHVAAILERAEELFGDSGDIVVYEAARRAARRRRARSPPTPAAEARAAPSPRAEWRHGGRCAARSARRPPRQLDIGRRALAGVVLEPDAQVTRRVRARARARPQSMTSPPRTATSHGRPPPLEHRQVGVQATPRSAAVRTAARGRRSRA